MTFSNSIRLMLFYRLPVVILCGVIFWQSSFPSVIHEQLFSFQDKVLHFGVYGLLSFLTARCLRKERPALSPLELALAATLFASLYGLSDEIHQAFVPMRDGSFFDFLADIAGSIAGATAFLYFVNILSSQIIKDQEKT